MHKALKARPVKGCTAAVCELDRTGPEIKVNRIPNFSAFHNFFYEEDDLRMWKAYDIGQVRFVFWSDLDVQVPSAIALPSASESLQFWDVQPRTMELQKESIQRLRCSNAMNMAVRIPSNLSKPYKTT